MNTERVKISFHYLYIRTIYAPNGLSASFAILKNCFPKGIPTMVMHHKQPIRKLPRAIHHPLMRNQITFTRNETTPPPYSILLPNGQNEIVANLKHCRPYGIPIIEIHHSTPDNTHAIPLIKPPNINQQIFPKSLIYYLLIPHFIANDSINVKMESFGINTIILKFIYNSS